MITIPRCMSTQHPDNVSMPFFASGGIFSEADEILEAMWAFQLGCAEQMWDYEGKEADSLVCAKLLEKYGNFFRTNFLGKDIYLTLRIPNPEVEKVEGKILFEILESIPRSFDTVKSFYQKEKCPQLKEWPPIFELILPMTTSSISLNRIFYYYQIYVGKKGYLRAFPSDKKEIKDWVGSFQPENIQLIPLFEDKRSLLLAHKITEEYLQDKKQSHQRVFLARSDPAENYGVLSAVFLLNISLERLHILEKKTRHSYLSYYRNGIRTL